MNMTYQFPDSLFITGVDGVNVNKMNAPPTRFTYHGEGYAGNRMFNSQSFGLDSEFNPADIHAAKKGNGLYRSNSAGRPLHSGVYSTPLPIFQKNDHVVLSFNENNGIVGNASPGGSYHESDIYTVHEGNEMNDDIDEQTSLLSFTSGVQGEMLTV